MQLRRLWVASFLLTFLVAGAADAAPRDVVMWFPLDDGQAGDETGNGNDGQVFGNPTQEPGLEGLGNALRFDGVDDAILVSTSGDLEADDVSISLWVRIDETPAEQQPLVRKLQGSTGFQLRIVPPAGNVAFEVRQDAGNSFEVTSEYPVMPGRWTFIYATYDQTNARIYLDGDLAATSTQIGLGEQQHRAPGDRSRLRGAPLPPSPGSSTTSSSASAPERPPESAPESRMVWDSPSGTCLPSFADLSVQLGLQDTDHRHFGATLVDVNQDGFVDLYYVNGWEDPIVEIPPTGTCPEWEGDEPPHKPGEPQHVLHESRRRHLHPGPGAADGDRRPVERDAARLG